jgi:hypothetical protein
MSGTASSCYQLRERTRRTLIAALARRHSISWDHCVRLVIQELSEELVFATVGDCIEAVAENMSPTAAADFAARLDARRQRKTSPLLSGVLEIYGAKPGISRRSLVDNYAESLIYDLPDPLFSAAFRLSLTPAQKCGIGTDWIKTIVAKSGDPYRWGTSGIEPQGDVTTAELSVAPAIDAMEDARLRQSRQCFNRALEARSTFALSRAVDDVRRALEEALLALVADSRLIPSTNGHTVSRLFKVLVDGRVLDNRHVNLIDAASTIRNKTSSGHGGLPDPTSAECDAAIAAGATAIVFLASFLSPAGHP